MFTSLDILFETRADHLVRVGPVRDAATLLRLVLHGRYVVVFAINWRLDRSDRYELFLICLVPGRVVGEQLNRRLVS